MRWLLAAKMADIDIANRFSLRCVVCCMCERGKGERRGGSIYGIWTHSGRLKAVKGILVFEGLIFSCSAVPWAVHIYCERPQAGRGRVVWGCIFPLPVLLWIA